MDANSINNNFRVNDYIITDKDPEDVYEILEMIGKGSFILITLFNLDTNYFLLFLILSQV